MPADPGENLFVSLHEALKGVYRSEQELEMLAGLELGRSLDQLTPPGTLEYRIFRFVGLARARDELLAGLDAGMVASFPRE